MSEVEAPADIMGLARDGRPSGHVQTAVIEEASSPTEQDACPEQRDHMLPSHRSFFEEIVSSDPAFWHTQAQREGGPDAGVFYDTFNKTISTYQEQPQLLDPVLEGVVGRLASVLLEACGNHESAAGRRSSPPAAPSVSLSLASYVSRFLWKVSVVRGYKTVLRFMPCDVFSVEPVLRFLNHHTACSKGRVDADLSWECQYVLLMWSSQLVMVPFAFEVVCETSKSNYGSATEEGVTDVIGDLVRTCRHLLQSASASRDMAAVCLGRLLTRPDMGEALVAFGAWAEGELCEDGKKCSPRSVTPSRQFLVPGIALAIATIFKFGKSQDATIRELVIRFVPIAVRLYESAECTRNPLIRKLSTKIVHRGATLLITGQGVDLEESPVEELLGSAVMALLSGLNDRDTIVRWSAAKGVGRVAAKLEAEFADQLLDSILEHNLCDSTTGEDAWHGGCLAIAELTRRELIASRRVDDLVPVIRDGLRYDVRRGYTSVGTNVRDAAAYVCWALARTQSREEMASALQTLAPVLMTTACYDREVNCRRAASAAFQECVGRLGDFPHGIDILTVADYFSVSLRTAAYLEVAPLVAAFEGYHRIFVDHLIGSKLVHWDSSVRELAAEALARLVPVDTEYHRSVSLERLSRACMGPSTHDGMHGTTLGLAYILPAVKAEIAASGQSTWLDVPLRQAIIGAVIHLAGTFEKSTTSTGSHTNRSTLAGGENMRSALCRLIHSVSICNVPLGAEGAEGAQDAIYVGGYDSKTDVLRCMYAACRENLRHPAENVQQDASRALAALLDAHVEDPAFPVSLADVTSSLTAEMHPDLHFGARRGAAMAFGMFPARLIARGHKTIFDAVSQAIYPEEQLAVRDVETRVNAIRSLPHVVRGALSTNGEISRESYCQRALDALLVALEDYSTDNRGDIGSWAREAAASAGVDLLMDATSVHTAGEATVVKANEFVAKVLRLILERIGRVRISAGHCLQRLLGADQLGQALGLPDVFVASARALRNDELLEGRAAARLFKCCLAPTHPASCGDQLATSHNLAAEALLGAVYAIGGLDAELRDFTVDHLIACISESSRKKSIANLFLSLWQAYAKHGRLSAAFVQTADAILSRTELVEDETFVSAAVDATVDTIHGSGDVAKLCKAAALLGTVAGEELGECRARAVMGLVALMGRKYPRVRTTAAEELYTAMITWDEPMEDANGDLMSILTGTVWGGVSAPLIREQRLKLKEKLVSILNMEPCV